MHTFLNNLFHVIYTRHVSKHVEYKLSEIIEENLHLVGLSHVCATRCTVHGM